MNEPTQTAAGAADPGPGKPEPAAGGVEAGPSVTVDTAAMETTTGTDPACPAGDDHCPQALLSLVVSPAVADAMVDWLLEHEGISGFTSFPINGHGASVHSMTAAERVSGHRRMILFQSYLPLDTAETLLKDLKQAFAGSGIHYWMTPLIAGGHMD